MSYDELEAQYYIVLQQKKDLERENNSLALRNTELETDNVILETKTVKAERYTKILERDLIDANCKVAELRTLLDAANQQRPNEEEHAKIRLIHQAVDSDAKILQSHANLRNPIQDGFSIRAPMQLIETRQNNVILTKIDIMEAGLVKSPLDYSTELHTMAKLGDKIFRYSGKSLLDLDRHEDFAVTLNQMIEALKYQIADQYARNYKYHFH